MLANARSTFSVESAVLSVSAVKLPDFTEGRPLTVKVVPITCSGVRGRTGEVARDSRLHLIFSRSPELAVVVFNQPRIRSWDKDKEEQSGQVTADMEG